MHDRVCVVTGATRGIGRATAMALARLGAHVVLVGRDERRLDEVRVETRSTTGNAQVFWVRADLASLVSVRHAAAEIAHRWPAIHVLVNNAGVNSARRATSVDGHELTFAVNHLGPFLLTTQLIPALTRGAPSRIVNVTSVFGHFGRLRLDDPMFERHRYSATSAYTQSKVATAMFTLELADRLESTDITVNCVSPGLVATDLLREHGWFASPRLHPLWTKLLLSTEQAASRVVRVATSDALAGITGQCFGGSTRPLAMPWDARDAAKRRALWDLSAKMTSDALVRSDARDAR